MKTIITALLVSIGMLQAATAQNNNWKDDTKVSVLFGLAQPVFASGFNIEGNLIYKRFIFDYSHGASLNFKGNLVTTDLQKQGIAVSMPYTTGFGIGYRIKDWLNLRVEPKWHRFEYYYEGEPQNTSTRIAADNTFSLGLGLYGFFQPFKKQENLLKGITLAPSIRFWPTLSSIFTEDKFDYLNKNTDQVEALKTLGPGVGFSPLIVNVSVGYTFDLRKKQL
jgi:hypothetical protein